MLPFVAADASPYGGFYSCRWRSYVTIARGNPQNYSTLRTSPDELSRPGATFFIAESQGWEPIDNEQAERTCAEDGCTSSFEEYSDFQYVKAGPADGHDVTHTVIAADMIGVFTDVVLCHTAGTRKPLYACHSPPEPISFGRVHTAVKVNGNDELNDLIFMCHVGADLPCHIVTPGDVFFYKQVNSIGDRSV